MLWTIAENNEMNVIHVAPARIINTPSMLSACATPVNATVTPRMAIAVETTASVDQRARALHEQCPDDGARTETAEQHAVSE
jgi:hypothetical protein